METLTIFPNCLVIADEVDALLDFGREKHWFFELMNEKGVLNKPIDKSGWLYVPIEMDSTILPREAETILDAVRKNSRIKQAIIGHEVKEVQEEETKESQLPKAEPKNIPWEGIAKVSLAVLTGTALVLLYGIAMALSAVDPCLIVVLDDPDETWVCLARWDE